MVTHDLSEAFRLATRVIAFERDRNRPEEKLRYGATISRDLEIYPRRKADVRNTSTIRSGGDDLAATGA
jgi:NitT/TauT family transport system ATP-binding protein